jgi:hypothetical protein
MRQARANNVPPAGGGGPHQGGTVITGPPPARTYRNTRLTGAPSQSLIKKLLQRVCASTDPLLNSGERRVRLTEFSARPRPTGRGLKEFTTFLAERAGHELPGVLATLIGDITRRATQLTDLGHARVIGCADPALAALIAHDRTLRPLCHLLGDRHLAIPLNHELKFRTALLKLGYAMPGPGCVR